MISLHVTRPSLMTPHRLNSSPGFNPGLYKEHSLGFTRQVLRSPLSMPKYKLKYTFSRAKWYEAKRAPSSDTVRSMFKYNGEQYSWCVKHFGQSPLHPDAWCRWYMLSDRFRFRDEKDYIWFMLKWT